MTGKPRKRLGTLAATAICGNDITSSCLYVSALTILYAGWVAPLALLMVSVVLFLYRGIYSEVVGALPFNGGAYNALLNTTSKFKASTAACLTLLSYMATAVLSANEAVHYAHSLWQALPITGTTIGLLATFCGLTILGISESSRVAITIFLTHLTSLALLIVLGIVYVSIHGLEVLADNLQLPAPGGIGSALFFGFAAAMLGISGFESSANFVEEQAEGVFPKTLRNMWVAVTAINPTIAILALALIPIRDVEGQQHALLAHLGQEVGGTTLATLISVDAVFVLCGAVLTSYVGVHGLVKRMTLDRCLPQSLLAKNRRGTHHRILLCFFAMAVSILWITHGELKALAGVYTISFLSVMALFGVGNVLLKVKRAHLPRPKVEPWPLVALAIAMVLAGLAGNALQNPEYVKVFLEYFVPALLLVTVMLVRVGLLKVSLYLVRHIIVSITRPMSRLTDVIRSKIEEINSQQVVFFTHGDDVAHLNSVLLYLRKNEHTNRLKLVTVLAEDDAIPSKVRKEIEVLDRAYPDIDVEFVEIPGTFGPALIHKLSREWRIPSNLMFIGSPTGKLRYSLGELGGVRLII